MNIFVLDFDPRIAAQYLCDQHIVKMCLETAQILSTVNGGPYKSTHMNHPCTIWTRSGLSNYEWLVEHGKEIADEYTRRFNKVHGAEEVIYALADPLVKIPPGKTDFVLCMPDEYKTADPVSSYRAYYKSKTFAKYNHSQKPEWL